MPLYSFKLKVLFTSILFLILFSPTVIHGRQEYTAQNKDLTIICDDTLAPATKKIITLYPVIRDELEKLLGWEVDFRPTIVLIKDNETFIKMSGHQLIVAYALPEQELIVMDYSKMRIDPFSIKSIIKHELCHLLLHKKIKRNNLPLWLDEGVAQWVSGGLADIIMNDHRILDTAILSNQYIPLHRIEYQFPRENKLLTLAYAESKSLVEYIAHEFGTKGILDLLRYLHKDYNIDSAVYESFSISFDEFEKRWYKSLKKEATWITFVINNLYSILFFIASLLLIYGFIKILLKKRAYREMDEWDND